MIIGCSHGKHIARKIAKQLKQPYSELLTEKFPDGETYLKFNKDVKNKIVVLVQSFYNRVNDCLIEILFASQTAKELGAKKVVLVAPYFPYLRQDKRFKKGECIAIKNLAEYINDYVDEIFIIDPHLHRKNTLKEIFKIKSHKLSANNLIAEYIQTKIKNPILVGPDFESYRWARETANLIDCNSIILDKKRYSSKKVKIAYDDNLKIVKDRNVVIVDDIISTGHTILETIKLLKKHSPKSINCICIHGIFADNSFNEIISSGAKIISCNTIPHKTNKIDVSELISDELKKSIFST